MDVRLAKYRCRIVGKLRSGVGKAKGKAKGKPYIIKGK